MMDDQNRRSGRFDDIGLVLGMIRQRFYEQPGTDALELNDGVVDKALAEAVVIETPDMHLEEQRLIVKGTNRARSFKLRNLVVNWYRIHEIVPEVVLVLPAFSGGPIFRVAASIVLLRSVLQAIAIELSHSQLAILQCLNSGPNPYPVESLWNCARESLHSVSHRELMDQLSSLETLGCVDTVDGSVAIRETMVFIESPKRLFPGSE